GSITSCRPAEAPPERSLRSMPRDIPSRVSPRWRKPMHGRVHAMRRYETCDDMRVRKIKSLRCFATEPQCAADADLRGIDGGDSCLYADLAIGSGFPGSTSPQASR